MLNLKKLIFIISFICSAQATETDYRALNFSNNYDLGKQNINQDDFVKFKPADLSAQFGIGAQCGKIGFKTNFRAALRKIKSQLKSKALITSLALASPMLLACQYNPALCSAIKNTEQTANFIMQLSVDQCAIIDKFTSQKAQAYNQKMADCVGMAKEQGLDLLEAQDKCNETASDKLASITGNKRYVGTINVLKDSFTWLGITDDATKEAAKELVGETTINHGVIKTVYGKEGKLITPLQKEIKRKNELLKKVCSKLDSSTDAKQNGIISFLKKEKLYKSISAHFYNKTLENLMLLYPNNRAWHCNNLVSYVAHKEVYGQTSKVYDALSQAITNPNLQKMEEHILQKKINILKFYLESNRYNHRLTSQEISQKINNEAKQLGPKIYNMERQNSNTSKDLKSIKKDITNKCQFKVRC